MGSLNIDLAGNVTTFGYDAMGSLTNLTDAKTNVTAWTYNLLSQLLRTFFRSYFWPKWRRRGFGLLAALSSYFVTE